MCHRVTKAPKGSAVFDVVGERVYAGIVLERMHAKGTNITSGLVQYTDDGGRARKAHLRAAGPAGAALCCTD